MGKQVSLTLAVADEFIETVEILCKAHEPGEIPKLSDRNPVLLSECLREASDEHMQWLKKRAKMISGPPPGTCGPPKDRKVTSVNPLVMRRAEQLYSQRSTEKQRIVNRTAERFRSLFDRYRVAFEQSWKAVGYPVDTMRDYYFKVANPEACYTEARQVVLQDLYRLRLQLEDSTKNEDQGEGAISRVEVKRRLLTLVDEGEPYTSLRELAERPVFGCAPNTIRNAIEESPLLKEWQRLTATSRKPRSNGSPEDPVVRDNAVQGREPDPANEAAEKNIRITLERLMRELDEEGRARLEKLDPQDRRKLARIVSEQRGDDPNAGRPDADAPDVLPRKP